ncbi:MAG: RlmE family RNA methyltransferase [Betaproteobacteria bacterium]|nr:RlmE family RNA methyltransferase [Betaproteobacteria bacterium]
MKPSSKAWMRRHVSDTFVKQAQARGYRSRAAFKLLEIAKRDRLIGPGASVVDLGAAPGSWSQVISEQAGARGRVIALDLLEMSPVPGVAFIQGDFCDNHVLAELESALGGRPVDLVVSDMAPNISGIAAADQARSLHLCELALKFACKHLKKGGNFLVKTFQGSGFAEFRKAVHRSFMMVASRKPEASRDSSTEMYLLGKGFKGR